MTEHKITFHKHEVVGARIAREMVAHLGIPKQEQDMVVKLVRNHQFYFQEETPDKKIESWIAEMGIEAMEYQLDLRVSDRMASGKKSAKKTPRTKEYMRVWSLYQKALDNPNFFFFEDLDVSRYDLKSAGVPVEKITSVLHSLRSLVRQDKNKNNKETLLSFVPKVTNND